VTVDDVMQLRSIVDARMSPKGDLVAYVVSTPSLARNQHEAALYVVAASGTAPRRLAESAHIFNTPLPSPKLRWSPDGTRLSFLALTGRRPQIVAVSVASGDVRTLTDAPEGVFGYEWAPDGRSVAYLTRDPTPPDEARAREDQSFVVHADAPDRAARIAVQAPYPNPRPVQYQGVLDLLHNAYEGKKP
jgi:dipeptidyl aminopeptidase/acylaminoacyl peptidase